MLAQVISNQQPLLHTLYLDANWFSSANTEKLLTRILECGVLSTLKELDLYESADFSSDESVRKLGYILSIAPNLTKCDISWQQDDNR